MLGVAGQVGLVPWRRLLGVPDQRGDVPAIGIVDLDAMVAPVGHVHIAIRVHGHTRRPFQRADTVAAYQGELEFEVQAKEIADGDRATFMRQATRYGPSHNNYGHATVFPAKAGSQKDCW